ncbi:MULTISPECIES: replicative DNA helicase [Aedoeadaptatus]|uniref:Replicative DNA helicase n=1 Tax=Aedoeadaptatus acetigenes TaxID=2981723 RepID=A0ABV1J4W4_9FIRM|nr:MULTISPECIES: replicative DNA helicase [Peptoniphilaceae]MCU6786521.1 replicative DNA helicase [Aedoeadaptatus acetigenes]
MAERVEGRMPPYDEQAEASVLGAMLLDKSAITTAVEIIHAEDFYYDSHKAIFEGILRLYNKNEPADMITLSDFLKKNGQLEAVGGYTYLGRLTSGAGAVSNTEAYANIIKEKSTLRALIRAGSEIVEDSYRDDDEVGAIIEKAEKSIFDITQDNQRGGLMNMENVMVTTFEVMQKRSENKGGLTGLTTGFIDLDRKTSGMQKADLVLLAARPSMGKTALMVNIATNAALKANATVAMFSLEMSRNQLSQRILSSLSHVDLMKIISGDLTTEEWSKVIETMTYMNEMAIYIDDTAGITPLEVKAKCRRLKAEKGLDLVVIDYLQLMEVGGRAESRQQEISAISRQLKGIAKELDVPVIALSQLSRAPEMRADHRPILSDLRESGAIEQDADIVMFLYRDEYYNPDTEKQGLGELIIAKHRNGPTGTVELLFKGEYTKFVNLQA